MSEASLADVKATKCIYFFYLLFAIVAFLLSAVIENWCVNIYSVSIFIITRFQIHQIPKLHNQTPQTQSPNSVVSTPVVYGSSSQKYQSMQKQSSNHIYNFIGLYPYNPPPEGFQWVPNGWELEKKEKDVSFDKIFVGKIRSVTKSIWKKGCSNVDL